ncbi:Ecdysteroid kinase-like family [Popillia japonica]|uniref:Ecdysteroid kinase-like family n=1 Tax=Popillia japonica TaxID=7064 RepID=A0AAW1K2P9_POPJA
MTVDLPLCPEDVNQVLQEIIAREKFQNPTVVFSQGSKIGQGCLGVDTAVEITEGNRKLELFVKTAPKHEKFRELKLELFVKTAPKHEKFRELMHIRPAYCNEFRFYNTIYTEMDKFHQEKTGRPMNIAAKYYGGSDEEMKEIIVMENVKVEGFSTKNLKEPLDKDQGNFELFNLRSNYNQLEKFLGSSTGGKKILEKFKYLADNGLQIILGVKECDSSYVAVTHGDCNGNNLMFRNKDGDLDLRLIDFQGVKVASPMMDLTYSFYGSCTSEENLSLLDYYLDVYYEALSGTIKELGSNPDKLYPKSLIKEDWKKFCGFSLTIAIPVIRASLLDVEFNIVEAVENPPSEEEQERFLNDNYDNQEFARRMGVLFQHLIDHDFI